MQMQFETGIYISDLKKKISMEFCTCLGDTTTEVACTVCMPLVKCFQVTVFEDLYITVGISRSVMLSSSNIDQITSVWYLDLYRSTLCTGTITFHCSQQDQDVMSNDTWPFWL